VVAHRNAHTVTGDVFPRHTIAWKIEHKTRLRRVALSLPWYGLGCGAVLRAYRWLVLALIAPAAWGSILFTITIGIALICGLAAAHLANFTLRTWRWRAPLLGAFFGLGESLASLVLTLLGQERMGRSLATLAEWPATLLNVVLTRTVIVSLFALALGAVVVGLRDRADRKSAQAGDATPSA
jgi:hypothetical protein